MREGAGISFKPRRPKKAHSASVPAPALHFVLYQKHSFFFLCSQQDSFLGQTLMSRKGWYLDPAGHSFLSEFCDALAWLLRSLGGWGFLSWVLPSVCFLTDSLGDGSSTEKFCAEFIFHSRSNWQIWTGKLSLVLYGSPFSRWGHIWFGTLRSPRRPSLGLCPDQDPPVFWLKSEGGARPQGLPVILSQRGQQGAWLPAGC